MSELEQKIKELEKSNAYLMGKLAYYEQDGAIKLYYSLQRKANEMAELLNRINLLDIELIDPKDKSFERLQKLWSEAGNITVSIRALEISAGINQEGKENKKEAVIVNKRPFSPESVADEIGELAGKRS